VPVCGYLSEASPKSGLYFALTCVLTGVAFLFFVECGQRRPPADLSAAECPTTLPEHGTPSDAPDLVPNLVTNFGLQIFVIKYHI
jgi:hypothetical protein